MEGKEERLRLQSIRARRFIALLAARALCDRISSPCQDGSRQQDVVIARPSVAHRIGAFEARGGTERHVTPQVVDGRKKQIRRQSRHGNVFKLVRCYVTFSFLRDEHLIWFPLLSNSLFLHRCGTMLTPFSVSITQPPPPCSGGTVQCSSGTH